MKTLIVYFSLTGSTRKICAALQKNMDAEMEALRPQRRYCTLGARALGTFAAARRMERPIFPLKEDVSAFDRIVLATPVWGGHLPPPVVTFLRCYDLRDKPVYLLLTHSGNPGQVEQVALEEVKHSEGILSGITLMETMPKLMNGLEDQALVLWLNTEEGKVRIEQMAKGYPNITRPNRRA